MVESTLACTSGRSPQPAERTSTRPWSHKRQSRLPPLPQTCRIVGVATQELRNGPGIARLEEVAALTVNHGFGDPAEPWSQSSVLEAMASRITNGSASLWTEGTTSTVERANVRRRLREAGQDAELIADPQLLGSPANGSPGSCRTMTALSPLRWARPRASTRT